MKLSLRAISLFSFFALAGQPTFAADLKQSKFTQVVNDAKVLEMPSKAQKPAAVNQIFKAPDVLKTGPASRVEMIAEDNTVTRVGANSIFSFDADTRTIDLQQGSVLFHSPKGKGGGTIRTTSAAASVLGTTIMVSTVPQGMKVLVLEGTGKVTSPSGKTVILQAGQMVFVLPNGDFSPIVTFNLEKLVEGSLLVNGFNDPLASRDLIEIQIDRQNRLIANGRAVDTGFLVGDSASVTNFQLIDPGVISQRFEDIRHHLTHHEEPPPSTNPPPPSIVFDLIIRSIIVEDEHLSHPTNNVSLAQGNNVLVDSSVVDLSPVASSYEFTIKANNIMQFNDNASHSTKFKTLTLDPQTEGSVEYLYLVANQFIFPENFEVSFDGYGLSLLSPGDLNLSSSGQSGLLFEAVGSSFATAETVLGYGSLSLGAHNDMNLSGNISLYAYEVNLEAGRNMNLDGIYIGSVGSAYISAGETLSAKGLRFGLSSPFINLAAKTIVLENIVFPTSTVYLQSQVGQLAANPNTGAAVQPGYVNFVRDVYYGNRQSPAQNYVGDGIYIFSLEGGLGRAQQKSFQQSGKITSSSVASSKNLTASVGQGYKSAVLPKAP